MNPNEDQAEVNHATHFCASGGLWWADEFYEVWGTIFLITRHSNIHRHSVRHGNSPMPNSYPATCGATIKGADVPTQQSMPRRHKTCRLMARCGIPIRMLQPPTVASG